MHTINVGCATYPEIGRLDLLIGLGCFYLDTQTKGFVGYGDAGPSNTSSVVRGAEIRVAETRTVNRAMRKAYGIGLSSVEELGSYPFFLVRASRR